MQIVVYSQENGVAAVLVPNPKSRFTLDEIVAKDVPPGADYELLNVSDLPADKTFRAAWRKGPGRVDVDMPSAREIHMDRIREARNEKLQALDRTYLIADEAGDLPGKAAVAAQKQALRDLPVTFDLDQFADPESLAAAWPVELT